jgi:nucleoside-diphosphate-sugar epimerase
MRILFTGASSFTGFAFVKALAAAGHEIVCPLRGKAEGYKGIRGERVEQLRSLVRFAPEAPFGSASFLKVIREDGPWDLLSHHAAEVTDYKSPDFDPIQALENNTKGLGAVLSAFKQSGGKGVLLTGTVFEPDEGTGDEPLRAFSPYGLSKGLTWQVFRFYCVQAGVPLGKFVIPNPFGPWEEPRFTAYLMNTWKDGKTAQVMTPDYIRDNIHVDLLAAVYARFSRQLGAAGDGCIKANPSGYVESQGAFASRVAREVKARTGWPCALDIMAQKDFPEPRSRANSEPAIKTIPEWNEKTAWDAFVHFYVSRKSESSKKTKS